MWTLKQVEDEIYDYLDTPQYGSNKFVAYEIAKRILERDETVENLIRLLENQRKGILREPVKNEIRRLIVKIEQGKGN